MKISGDTQRQLSTTLRGTYMITQNSLKETLQWILEIGCSPLPVNQKTAPGAGKQPGFWDGERFQPVAHGEYQDRFPTPEEIQAWFEPGTAHQNGVAALLRGNVVAIDIDAKHFIHLWQEDKSEDEYKDLSRDEKEEVKAICYAHIDEWLKVFPKLAQMHRAKTPNGYRILLRCKQQPDREKFTFDKAITPKMGELLRAGKPATLPPTEAREEGTSYEWIYFPGGELVEIESMSEIGIEVGSIAQRDTNKTAEPKLLPLPIAKFIVGELDLSRCDDYEEWLGVGMALHATGSGDEAFLAVWDQWSANSPKYKAGECQDKWETFGISPVQVSGGGLVRWLVEDARKGDDFNCDRPHYRGTLAVITKIIKQAHICDVFESDGRKRFSSWCGLVAELVRDRPGLTIFFTQAVREQLSRRWAEKEYPGAFRLSWLLGPDSHKAGSVKHLNDDGVKSAQIKIPYLSQLNNAAELEKFIRSRLGHYLKFNELALKAEFKGTEVDDGLIMSQLQNDGFTFAVGKSIASHVVKIAREQPYYPPAELLKKGTWDGIDRISTLVEKMRIKNKALGEIYFKKILMAGAARAFAREDKPVLVQTGLILIGPQGVGKSRAIAALGLGYHAEPKITPGMSHKDTVMLMHSGWVLEVDEIEGLLRGKESSYTKSLLSQEADSVRLPYGRQTVMLTKHYVVFGTSNETNLLSDPTGNRRFWVLEIEEGEKIDVEWVRKNAYQLWLQGLHLVKQGERWYLTDEEEKLREEENGSFHIENPFENAARAGLALASQLGTECGKVALQELVEVLAGAGVRFSGKKSDHIADAARSAGAVDRRRKTRRYWEIPPTSDTEKAHLKSVLGALTVPKCSELKHIVALHWGGPATEILRKLSPGFTEAETIELDDSWKQHIPE